MNTSGATPCSSTGTGSIAMTGSRSAVRPPRRWWPASRRADSSMPTGPSRRPAPRSRTAAGAGRRRGTSRRPRRDRRPAHRTGQGAARTRGAGERRDRPPGVRLPDRPHLAHLRYFAELAATYPFEQATPPLEVPDTVESDKVHREPIGVYCAGIVPWNFPLVLGIWKIAPALAAGNSIVVKPDEHTPLSLIALARIALECGVPPGVFNIVTGDGPDVGARLASHPDVGKVAFTGSTEVGREIMRLASGTVKKVCAKELGGKGAAIVLDDADLDAAVDAALFGSWLYCGQMCESCTRLLLPGLRGARRVRRAAHRAWQWTVKLGDPNDFDTDMGPVLSAVQRDRVLGYIEIARQEGATVAFGGGVPEGPGFERGYWVQPADPHRCHQGHARGAGGDLRPCPLRDPLLRRCGQTRRSRSPTAPNMGSPRRCGARTTSVRSGWHDQRPGAGTVWINDVHMVSAAHPFGGYKQSGLGRRAWPPRTR